MRRVPIAICIQITDYSLYYQDGIIKKFILQISMFRSVDCASPKMAHYGFSKVLT